jgi:6-phosphofructokinase 1
MKIKERIERYFKDRSLDLKFKYIDPSYMIRGVPANPQDSIYCARLAPGQHLLRASGAKRRPCGDGGKNRAVIGYWHGHYVHVPIDLAVSGRKQVDPGGDLWHSVIESTGQTPKVWLATPPNGTQ